MSKRTPLYDLHRDLGARMTEFSGWEMPVQYSSIREEHQAVRERVGLFDISHMGEIVVSGPGAHAAVQMVSCNDLDGLAPKQCQYSALLTHEGTFVDDIILYPLATDRILICTNASNTTKDFEWIQKHIADRATIQNESEDWCQLAIQGPRAEAVMKILAGEPAAQLRRFYFATAKIAGITSLISRTGYTGEDGFEIYAPMSSASGLWQQILTAGKEHDMIPCGLGARDTLRLEAAYPLYGHEIGDTINPFEARLAWIVRLNKGDFIGKPALEEVKAAGAKRQLIGFQMEDRSIPRQGYTIYLGEAAVGPVVSGTLSPSLNIGIGTGFLPTGLTEGKIAIDIRDKKRKATIVKLPFWKR